MTQTTIKVNWSSRHLIYDGKKYYMLPNLMYIGESVVQLTTHIICHNDDFMLISKGYGNDPISLVKISSMCDAGQVLGWYHLYEERI